MPLCEGQARGERCTAWRPCRPAGWPGAVRQGSAALLIVACRAARKSKLPHAAAERFVRPPAVIPSTRNASCKGQTGRGVGTSAQRWQREAQGTRSCFNVQGNCAMKERKACGTKSAGCKRAPSHSIGHCCRGSCCSRSCFVGSRTPLCRAAARASIDAQAAALGCIRLGLALGLAPADPNRQSAACQVIPCSLTGSLAGGKRQAVRCTWILGSAFNQSHMLGSASLMRTNPHCPCSRCSRAHIGGRPPIRRGSLLPSWRTGAHGSIAGLAAALGCIRLALADALAPACKTVAFRALAQRRQPSRRPSGWRLSTMHIWHIAAHTHAPSAPHLRSLKKYLPNSEGSVGPDHHGVRPAAWLHLPRARQHAVGPRNVPAYGHLVPLIAPIRLGSVDEIDPCPKLLPVVAAASEGKREVFKVRIRPQLPIPAAKMSRSPRPAARLTSFGPESCAPS